MKLEVYEDSVRLSKQNAKAQSSPYCDLVYYESSVTPDIRLAMLVKKPAKPSYMLVGTHGWHMSMPKFEHMDEPDPTMPYLYVQVDMRGRAFSTGDQDCNGLELIDVFDAVQEAKRLYADLLIDPDVIYFEGGSGGGGNAFAIAGKFPDMYSTITAMVGISDYAVWYRDDLVGEFRDDMDIWLGGKKPEDDPELYASRSGVTTVENVISPMSIIHGTTDERVPVCHSRDFVGRAVGLGKGHLMHYDELVNVGDQAHWGKANADQMNIVALAPELLRLRNRKPVFLPAKGELVVAGYVYTKHFRLMLCDIGKVARIRYDLINKKIEFITPEIPHSLTWL